MSGTGRLSPSPSGAQPEIVAGSALAPPALPVSTAENPRAGPELGAGRGRARTARGCRSQRAELANRGPGMCEQARVLGAHELRPGPGHYATAVSDWLPRGVHAQGHCRASHSQHLLRSGERPLSAQRLGKVLLPL